MLRACDLVRPHSENVATKRSSDLLPRSAKGQNALAVLMPAAAFLTVIELAEEGSARLGSFPIGL